MEEIKTVEEMEKRKKGVGERLDKRQRCPGINIHADLPLANRDVMILSISQYGGEEKLS